MSPKVELVGVFGGSVAAVEEEELAPAVLQQEDLIIGLRKVAKNEIIMVNK